MSIQDKFRSIPYIAQLEWTDCAAASLAMVLAFHGKHVELDRVRKALAVSRDGVTARAIVDAAGSLGLSGRGLKVALGELVQLPRGSILHWELSHYVVLDRVIGDKVRIIDPAHGERELSFEEVSRCFTGIALELTPRADFIKEQRGKNETARSYLRELFGERALFTRVVVVSLIMRLFALAMPLVTGLVIDWVVPRHDLPMLWIVLGSIIGLVFVQCVCMVMRAQLLLALRTNLDGKITLGFIDHLVSLPVGFFQRRSAGDLMMRVGSNATIRELITSQTLAAVIDGVFVMVYAVVIFIVSPTLGLIVFALAGLQVASWLGLRPKNRRLLAEDIERQAKAQSYLVQMLAGMETLKCAGAEGGAIERYGNLYADCLDMSLQRGRLGAMLDAVHSALSALAPMVILAFGAHSVITGQLSLGTMLAMTSLATSLFGPLGALVDSLMSLQLVRTYTDRINDVLRAEPEQAADSVLDMPQLTGAVSLRGVSLRYGDGPMVVNEVNLDVPAGASVALVGASGSGKSSLLNLLAGIVTPTKGSVQYDGVALTTLDLRAVRQQIGVVPQHPYIFGATIRENIALTAPQATAERIQQAARIAALDADLAAMPMGVDTHVSDGGASLSGGQRQRIALARAVLREPSVLLLDEATSALDTATEARITANLTRLRATRIIVAHRLSTVANADLIVVMDKGRIVETGNHAQLAAKRGHYFQLLEAAAGRMPQPQPQPHANKELHAQHRPAALPAGPGRLLAGPQRRA